MAAAASSSMAATATVTGTGTGTGTPKVCFNSNCKVPLEKTRKGWRRRTGEFADLCDRCASAYDEGKFCETFHLNSSGWRCCESCGKQIHCGCIVSFHMFVLLDAGGIECITCARKSFILTPNPAWPPPSLFLPMQPERIKDMPVRSWSSIAGSGPVPWRQAPSLFNGALVQPELQSRLPVEVDRLRFNERLSSSPLDKRKWEDSLDRLLNGNLAISRLEVSGLGTPVVNGGERPASLSHSQQTANSMTSGFSLAMASTSKPGIDDHTVAGIPIHRPTLSPQAEKRPCSQNQVDVAEAQPRNGKVKGDVRGKSQMHERYRPQISEEELQKISEDSNSEITPLFEKVLSASDAGKIGRLVLPKKCAETYFPPVSQPEGLPLKVQDLKGKEWVFQFRFWPNNNSRMYVLEGITPCIQSMQLQAGDIVTFSRIEPEGKLVMGCRKVSATSSEKGNETSNAAVNKSSITGETVAKGSKGVENAKAGEVTPANFPIHGKAASPSFPPLNQQTGNSASIWSEADKPGDVVVKTNSSARGKRKNNTVGLKRKRLRIDSEDVLELKVSWTEIQELFRSHSKTDPNILMIEGCEFEEFEQDAPVIGRPTIPQSEGHGKNEQWVQCEKCLKWRKVPADALLKLKWTCSENVWDTARSACSADEELTAEKLESLLPTMRNAVAEKMKDPMPDSESVDDALEGLDALANLAIQEKAASSQTTTRHPRHKPGCSCIVCIQPPSGKGPKHKQPCDCVVCKSVKRRWETLMLKREQKQSEKEPESGRQKLQTGQSPGVSQKIGTNRSSKEEGSSDEYTDNADELCSTSPLKGHIDLNIQPDREEDLSVNLYSGSSSDKLLDSKDRRQKQQRLLECIRGSMDSSATLLDTKDRHQKQQHLSECIKKAQVNQTQPDGIGHTNISKSVPLDNNHKSIDLDQHMSSSKSIAASTTPADG